MKKCEAEGCTQQFEPKTANQKYADKSCRKTLDISGLCKFRRENGLFEIPTNPVTGETPMSDAELKVSYAKLLSEYNKIKSKQDDLVNAVFRAVKEDVRATKYVLVPKPKLAKKKGSEEVAVAILSDWQLAKITPDYNSQVCEQRIYKFAEKIVELTNIQRQDHPVREIRLWALGDIIEGIS